MFNDVLLLCAQRVRGDYTKEETEEVNCKNTTSLTSVHELRYRLRTENEEKGTGGKDETMKKSRRKEIAVYQKTTTPKGVTKVDSKG